MSIPSSAPPDEMQTANSHPRTWKALMYQVRYERLTVNKIAEKELTPQTTPVSQEMDMNPSFIRWPTPGTSHHSVMDGQGCYFVKPGRTLSVLQ
ncbi:MAG: hypothetical protein ACO3MW_15280 [Rhodospirillales bacterium]